MSKQSYIPVVIEWAKRKGYEQIRANMEGFEQPIAYERQNDDERFIPDVTAKQLLEQSYFEIILKGDSPDKIVSKLRLLSMLVSQKGGRLFLMTPPEISISPKNSSPNTQSTAKSSRLFK